MSDLSDVGAPADPPPADPAAAPAADAPATPDPADPKGYSEWPEDARAERERLLDENIKYRHRWKPYEDVFGDLHKDDQTFLLGFAEAFRSGDPGEVARYEPALRAYLDKLTPQQQQAAVEAIETGAAEDFDPFDKAQVEQLVVDRAQRLLDERLAAERTQREEYEHKAEVARITKEIQSVAAQLGKEHGVPEWEDPTSGLYAALVSLSSRVEGEESLDARLAKAAETLQVEFDRRGQALLKAKTAGAGEGPAPQVGDEPSGRKEPTDLEEASRAAMARLEALAASQPGT